MSRLVDRIVAAGCPPLRVAELFRSERMQQSLGRAAERAVPGSAASLGMTERQLGQFVLSRNNAVGTVRVAPSDLAGMPVIAADNVADYVFSLPPSGQGLTELVTTVAPPFAKFFVECSPSVHLADALPVHAWGFLCGGADLTQGEWRSKFPDRRLASVMAAFAGFAPSLPALLANVNVRWVLQLVLFLELRKGHPMGPVAEHSFPLDDDGHLIALPDGEVASIEGLVGLTTPLLQDLESALLQHIDAQLIPALLAISLMHCRNVRVQTVEPPLALSRKAARRGGRPLVRYQVLDIGPMRTVLDHEGGARTRGLGHALHICRGHFKTFTDDAPLFGKHTGTYWWHDTARGTPKRGRVTTDYRVSPDQVSADASTSPDAT